MRMTYPSLANIPNMWRNFFLLRRGCYPLLCSNLEVGICGDGSKPGLFDPYMACAPSNIVSELSKFQSEILVETCSVCEHAFTLAVDLMLFAHLASGLLNDFAFKHVCKIDNAFDVPIFNAPVKRLGPLK